MLNSRFYLIGVLLVFLCTAGYSGVHRPISTLGDNGRGGLTTSYTFRLTDKDALTTSAKTQATVCILPGNASEAEHREYEACIAEAECKDWKKYQDGENGNTAMICIDKDEQANACILGENASEAEQIEFADCLGKIKCENWRRHKDSENGITIMMCEDE
ncbi:MAG: hypothetical protein OXD43_10835 [Bacteroidetes bacterium]|nr:hypothetical protein [Bacteroidota bacterium]